MSSAIAPARADNDGLIYTSEICDDVGVTDRCHRKWVTKGKFPAPDGNLNGRNFWFRSTYQRWKADVLAGRFSQRRRPGSQSVGPAVRCTDEAISDAAGQLEAATEGGNSGCPECSGGGRNG